MFFFLSKILLLFLYPFTWVLVGLGFAFFAKSAKWKKRGKVTALACILFFSNTFVYLEFCRMWEVHGTPVSELKHHDVAIVLGGMAEYNSDIKELSIRRGGDRIWQAITLYKTGKVDKLLISGDNGDLIDKGLHEAQQMKKVLVSWGIPAKDLIVETVSKNTHENAVETQKVLARSYPQYDSFILVTSGRHMRRALGCFEAEGMKCTPYSTDLYTGPNRHYTFDQLLIPDVSTMTDWNGLLKEWVGYVTYAACGYI